MNIEKLYKNLSKFKNNSNFNIEFTKGKLDLKKTINTLNDVSLDYSIDFLNYQKSYYEMNSKRIFDFSFFIKDKKKILTFCPLYVTQQKGFEITSNFKHILKPLFIINLDEVTIKNIINYYFELLDLLKKTLKIKKFSFISNNLMNNGLEYWDKKLLTLNYSTYLTFEQSINLENNNNYIWSNIRKSYKNLINKFKDDIKVNLCDKQDHKIWKNFQNFHLETSKRITRNQSTWDKQFISINNESAYFFYILDKKNKMIGGSLFDCTDIEANYSVAVYDRNLSKLPLGHLILNKSIEFFKKKKIKSINLGEINFNHENLDLKILNIQKFKSGFANKIDTKIIYKK